MIRLVLLRALNTVEAVAVLAVAACAIVRGFMLDEPPRQKRDPFTGQQERPN